MLRHFETQALLFSQTSKSSIDSNQGFEQLGMWEKILFIHASRGFKDLSKLLTFVKCDVKTFITVKNS